MSLTVLETHRVTTAQATAPLGLTPREIPRLRRTLRTHGPDALAHGNRARVSPHAPVPPLGAQILAIARGRHIGLNLHPAHRVLCHGSTTFPA